MDYVFDLGNSSLRWNPLFQIQVSDQVPIVVPPSRKDHYRANEYNTGSRIKGPEYPSPLILLLSLTSYCSDRSATLVSVVTTHHNTPTRCVDRCDLYFE